MKRSFMTIVCLCIVCSMSACQKQTVSTSQSSKVQNIQVDIKELAKGNAKFAVDKVNSYPWELESPQSIPKVSENGMGWDLRHKDMSNFDLSTSNNFSDITYDIVTKWPTQMPEDFNPQVIMENGKNPGLGIRALHEQGITGKGVNIAIIDQGLLLDHQEYKDNIQMYELLNCYDQTSSMHGPAVTSLAVGKTTGVAPGAKVYYIASDFLDMKVNKDGKYESKLNLTYMAKGIERILEINKILPDDEKIRVISISRGFNDSSKADVKEVYNAIEKAKKENILVITTSMNMNYDFNLLGLNRNWNNDPDRLENYSLGSWIDKTHVRSLDAIYVPMDSRTFAGFTSTDDYAYGASSGLSWTCPWLAGMYALCLQVNPDLTPDEFLKLAYDTSANLNDNQNSLVLKVIQPSILIEKVKSII